jgi:hypothetical protein
MTCVDGDDGKVKWKPGRTMSRDRQPSPSSTQPPVPSDLAPRPFVPQVQADTPEVVDIAKEPELLNLGKFSIFEPGAAPPPPSSRNLLQAKLTIGQPNDPYEQEADQMAAQVVQRMNRLKSASEPQPVQRQELSEEDKETLQRKPTAQAPNAVSADLESQIQGAKGGGQSLGDSIRQPMEQAFGADFSGVKVHTDAQSDQLNRSIQAKAFTTGQDVFFRQGAYDPGSSNGQELLAHELTHVVQQNGRQVAPIQRRSKISQVNAPGVQAFFGFGDTPQQKAQKQQEWQTLLENNKAAYANQLGQEFVGKLKEELMAAMCEGFKGESKRWDKDTVAMIVSKVQQAAETHVVKNMQQQGTEKGVAANIVQDAQKYARQYIASGTFDAAFSEYAREIVMAPSFGWEGVDQEFKKLTIQKFDAAKAKISSLSSVQSDAKDAVKEQCIEYRQRTKDSIANYILTQSDNVTQRINAIVATKLGTAGKKEVDDRQGADRSLLGADSQTWLENIYGQDIFKPLQVYLEEKFGANGMGFWSFRSTEAHRFRDAMKAAGRQQAYEDISRDIHTVDQTKDKTVAGKNYYETKADDYAYNLAKVSVNDQMKALAEAEVRDLLETDQGKVKLVTLLENAAKSSAYDAQRSGARDFAKVGQSAAKMEAQKLLAEKKVLAQKRKDEYFAKGAAPVRDTTQIKADVKAKITTDQVSKKSIKQVVESDTLPQGLTKIGKLIDLSAPNPGDLCSTQIQIKFPYETGTGQSVYVIIEFNGEAEREENELTVTAELSVGAGFETFGFDANAQIGASLKAKSATTASVTNLLSYGAFRELKSKSESLAYYLWGGGSSKSKRQQKEKIPDAAKTNSEQWASMIEEGELKNVKHFKNSDTHAVTNAHVKQNVFFEDSGKTIVTTEATDNSNPNQPAPRELAGKVQAIDPKQHAGLNVLVNTGNKDAYVESGGFIKGHAELNVGVAKGEADAKFSMLSRWTGAGEEKRKAFKLGGEAELAIAGQKVTLGLELSGAKTPEAIKAFELAVKGKITASMGGPDPLSDIERIGVQYGTAAAAGLRNLIQTYRRAADREEKAKGTKTVSNVASVLEVASGPLSQLEKGQSVAKAMTSALGTEEETVNDTMRSKLSGEAMKSSKIEEVAKITSERSLETVVKIGYEDGQWSFDISVAQIKSNEVDLGVFKAKVEKSERLAKLNISSEGVKGGLLGIEKT